MFEWVKLLFGEEQLISLSLDPGIPINAPFALDTALAYDFLPFFPQILQNISYSCSYLFPHRRRCDLMCTRVPSHGRSCTIQLYLQKLNDSQCKHWTQLYKGRSLCLPSFVFFFLFLNKPTQYVWHAVLGILPVSGFLKIVARSRTEYSAIEGFFSAWISKTCTPMVLIWFVPKPRWGIKASSDRKKGIKWNIFAAWQKTRPIKHLWGTYSNVLAIHV